MDRNILNRCGGGREGLCAHSVVTSQDLKARYSLNDGGPTANPNNKPLNEDEDETALGVNPFG